MTRRRRTRRPSRHRGRAGRLIGGTVLLASFSVVVLGAADPDGAAHAAPRSIEIAASGPLGPVTVFGDSVLLGSALYGPTLPDLLHDRGWGPIRFRAGEGYNTRASGNNSAGYWLGQWQAQGWDAPNVLINLGANDSTGCGTDSACARRSIQRVIDLVGPEHRIWWPQITRAASARAAQDTWNDALREFADERDDFVTWDWPGEAAGYPSSDGIHLSPNGYRARSERMADLFTRDLASARRVGGDAALPMTDQQPSTLVTLPAQRIVDSRSDGSGPLPAGTTRRVDVAAAVPPDATSVALYLTAARPQADGYLRAAPCGEASNASTVNYRHGAAIGAPTIVERGDGGDVCIFTSAPTDVVIDVQGAFAPGDDGLTFAALGTPTRLVDTRGGDFPDEVVIDVPSGAEAVAVNLTAVRATEGGYLRAYPCGDTTGTANLNFRSEGAWSAAAIVEVADDDTICVRSNVDAHIVVDLTGTFQPGPGLRFVPAPPTRMLDTRDGTGGWSPVQGSGQTLDVRVAPPFARAVTGTLTIVHPVEPSYVTAEPCTGSEDTSSANAAPRRVIANSVTVSITSAGRLCVTASATGHTIFDTTGWWVA